MCELCTFLQIQSRISLLLTNDQLMASPSIYCVSCGCDITNSKGNRLVRQHCHDTLFHYGVLNTASDTISISPDIQ